MHLLVFSDLETDDLLALGQLAARNPGLGTTITLVVGEADASRKCHSVGHEIAIALVKDFNLTVNLYVGIDSSKEYPIALNDLSTSETYPPFDLRAMSRLPKPDAVYMFKPAREFVGNTQTFWIGVPVYAYCSFNVRTLGDTAQSALDGLRTAFCGPMWYIESFDAIGESNSASSATDAELFAALDVSQLSCASVIMQVMTQWNAHIFRECGETISKLSRNPTETFGDAAKLAKIKRNSKIVQSILASGRLDSQFVMADVLVPDCEMRSDWFEVRRLREFDAKTGYPVWTDMDVGSSTDSRVFRVARRDAAAQADRRKTIVDSITRMLSSVPINRTPYVTPPTDDGIDLESDQD